MLRMQEDSQMKWLGLESKKFKTSVKTGYDLKYSDQSQGVGVDYVKHKKHYNTKLSDDYIFKPAVRQFQESNKDMLYLQDNKLKPIERTQQIKMVQQQITGRPVLHPQRLHLTARESGCSDYDKKGIRTGNDMHQEKRYCVEDVMGQRKMIDTIEQQRNFIDIKSQGDKAYKNGFFDEGGLATGQNHTLKKKTVSRLKADLKGIKIIGLDETKLWKNKYQQIQKQQDVDAIDELDNWVENTLKKANPNYKDPELFFVNMEQQQVNDKNTKKKK